MWLLIDPESRERICRKRFGTQADLANFLEISPKPLSRDLKLGRSVFQWNGKPAQVATQKQSIYSATTLEGDLCGTAKSKAELAKIIGVSRQAVYAAFARPQAGNGIRIKGFLVHFFFEKGILTPCKLKKDEQAKPAPADLPETQSLKDDLPRKEC